jgi:hypothetical protein
MTEADIKLLKSSVGSDVRIICYDGEVMTANVHWVSEQDGELSYDLISTTKESQYEKYDEQPVYLIRFKDIERVEPLQQRT